MAIRQGYSVATPGEVNGVNANRYWQNIDPKIRWKYNSIAPFLTILQKLGGHKNVTKNFKLEWYNRDTIPQSVVNSAAEGAADMIAFADGQFQLLRADDLLYNQRTAEVVRIDATPTAAGDVTVIRGYAGTTAAAVLLGDTWRRLASAVGEWSDVRDLIGQDPSTEFNYIQTVRDPFGASGHAQRIAAAGGMIGPSEMEYLREDRYRDHLLNLESTLLLGERSKSGTTYTTRGLMKWLTAAGTPAHNEDVGAAVFTRNVLNDFMYELSRESFRKSWLCICGVDLPNYVEEWAFGKLQINEKFGQAFGITVPTYKSRHGDIHFLEHPAFGDLGLDNFAMFLNMDCFSLHGFPGLSESMLYKGPNGNGLQPNGVDGVEYEYRWAGLLKATELNMCGAMTGIGDTVA
jgi:hypothetical protein